MAAKNNETPISKTADFPDITNLTYEQARDELISIVAQLEGGQIGLEDSMTLWQRGRLWRPTAARGSTEPRPS